MPEQHKSALRSSVRRRQAQARLTHRHHVLEGIYSEEGDALVDERAVGDAISAYWQLVFAEKVVCDDDTNEFLGYVQHSALGDWSWQRGAWVEALYGVADTTAGPDGIPYSLWRCAPREWTEVVDDLAEQATQGQPLPRWALDSAIVCIPKGEYQEDATRVLRRQFALRLITLMNTIAKIFARGGRHRAFLLSRRAL